MNIVTNIVAKRNAVIVEFLPPDKIKPGDTNPLVHIECKDDIMLGYLRQWAMEIIRELK